MNQAQFYFLLLLIGLSQSDWRSTKINSYLALPLAYLILYHHKHVYLTLIIIGYGISLTLNTLSHQRWLGHGDLDIFALGLTLLPPLTGLNWLWLASLSQLLCYICLPANTQLPFIPALTFAWLVITVI